MSQVLDIISWIAILGGAFFSITGAVGLYRFPDYYSRVHAAGMTDTLGALLILVGLTLQNGWDLNVAKYIFIFIFILYTGPTATHALAKAARHGGLMPVLEGKDEGKEPERKNTSEKGAE
jgi:multicomponent Na+:H+ antiporter subunit G